MEAVLTHKKYGICNKAIPLACGHIRKNCATIVTHTIKISRVASGIFFSPKNIGLNRRLAIRLIIKITPIVQESFPLNAFTRTYTNETTIIGYRIDQIIPMVLPGGVHEGFISASYQALHVSTGGIWFLLV
jgi:hypothetical protein